MEFLTVKCPDCGGSISFPEGRNHCFCMYCGSQVFARDVFYRNDASASSLNGFIIEAGILRKYQGESTSVVIPSTVLTIGVKAFESLPITDVVIPQTVRRIESEAFCECRELREIILPDSVEVIGSKAFYGCVRLEKVKLPRSIRILADYCFESCAFASIDIPMSVETIGDSCFKNTRLSSINIPSSVTALGDRSFSSCCLKTLHIPESVKSIGQYAFEFCEELEYVEMRSSCVIPATAFAGCKKIVSNYSEAALEQRERELLGISRPLGEIMSEWNDRPYDSITMAQYLKLPAEKKRDANDDPEHEDRMRIYHPSKLEEACKRAGVVSPRYLRDAKDYSQKYSFDEKKRIVNELKRIWQSKGRCEYCGGIKKVFGKKCKQCGR